VRVEPVGPGRYRLLLRGPLVLKGESTVVEVPLEVERVASGLKATGEARLGLRDLGLPPPTVAGVVKVANRFRVTFEVVAGPEGTGERGPVLNLESRANGIHNSRPDP
jgi:hypothetical protein